jgi:hypothetical protein
MTTLLEFILTQLIGPAKRTKGNGESFWDCPRCGAKRFHTLPDKPLFKHRARCWNSECGFGGDALDMLKEFYPDYSERLNQLDLYKLRFQEWLEKNRLASRRGVSKQRKGGKNNAPRR